MSSDALQAARASVPAGAWAVGVSGGADSVALLSLLRPRAVPGGDLSLHVVHLDHQTRGPASTDDAAFVSDLAARWGFPCSVAPRDEVEARLARVAAPAGVATRLPANASSRYRAARLALFREVVAARKLAGVLLAHHADDQAETVLHRLLRGSGYAGLAGMARRSTVGGLVILRPLLGIGREPLRAHVREAGQAWREDESNASDDYLRNRLRRLLAAHPPLTPRLLELSEACRAARDWARAAAPVLPATFRLTEFRDLPPILARESAADWLAAQGVPRGELAPAVIDRLLAMAADAATPPRQHYPGGVLVQRRGGSISRTGD
jgi:tRNA(Ile)-lysidine synthase